MTRVPCFLKKNFIRRRLAYSENAGYCGTAVDHVDNEMKLKLHISKRIKDEFTILLKRWIVERTFAWLGNFRRLAKSKNLEI